MVLLLHYLFDKSIRQIFLIPIILYLQEVHNTAVQFLLNQEEEMKNEQEARKALEIEQTKKLAKVRMTKM